MIAFTVQEWEHNPKPSELDKQMLTVNIIPTRLDFINMYTHLHVYAVLFIHIHVGAYTYSVTFQPTSCEHLPRLCNL